ncbi:DUF4374 domain-containing protein [uncultured Draconibacterium sp.]|uniref:DUF4374 domain-containing protein n=1 Tax=uncultured Draconibacterium sp. TaxID=1573823 RepID=UPI0025E6BD97|nr:DUF4374 domain-containing protein [uncultured Draconibacterium sp.]
MKQGKFLHLLTMTALLAVGTLLFSACSNDDDVPEVITEDANFALSLAYQGTDGNFTYYTVLFEDVMSGSLSAVGQGIDHLGYYTYNKIDDRIYATGGFELTDIIALEKNTAGELVETGGNSSFGNSLQDIVETEDGMLVAIEMASSSDVITLHRIDAETITTESTVNTAVSEITDLSGAAYSGMVQSGDFLFVSYYISDPATYATAHTDLAQVAVFSYPDLQFVKIIEDDRTGPVGGFGTKSGLIKDESGNVYALSHSNPANGFSQFTKDPAILRINSGDSEFDNNYIFDFNTVTDSLTTAHLVYLGNDKVFVEMNSADRREQSAWADGPLKPAVLDLSEKTINYISGVPEHSGLGRKLAATSLYDGQHIYLVVPEDVNSYVYQIDPVNYTATKGAEVQANFTAGFFKF